LGNSLIAAQLAASSQEGLSSMQLVLINSFVIFSDCLCVLVVRVPGYRSRGLGFVFWHYQIFREVVGLERGPLSLVSTIEELPERKK
jgi:hypothetical protein